MTPKRTRSVPSRPVPWKSLGAAIGIGVVVVGALFAARSWWGPQAATAQVRNPAPVSTPAANTAAPTRSQVPQPAQPKPDPAAKTVAMVNMDMVGRLKEDNKLTIFGNGTSPVWDPLLNKYGKEFGFTLTLKPQGFGPSDHSSFYGKQIPVLHFFTGTHTDYHRPSDDWEKINIAGEQRITDMIEKLVVDVLAANPEQVAQFRAGKMQVLGYLVGQIMKASGGKANPQQVNKILRAKLGA